MCVEAPTYCLSLLLCSFRAPVFPPLASEASSLPRLAVLRAGLSFPSWTVARTCCGTDWLSFCVPCLPEPGWLALARDVCRDTLLQQPRTCTARLFGYRSLLLPARNLTLFCMQQMRKIALQDSALWSFVTCPSLQSRSGLFSKMTTTAEVSTSHWAGCT